MRVEAKIQCSSSIPQGVHYPIGLGAFDSHSKLPNWAAIVRGMSPPEVPNWAAIVRGMSPPEVPNWAAIVRGVSPPEVPNWAAIVRSMDPPEVAGLAAIGRSMDPPKIPHLAPVARIIEVLKTPYFGTVARTLAHLRIETPELLSSISLSQQYTTISPVAVGAFDAIEKFKRFSSYDQPHFASKTCGLNFAIEKGKGAFSNWSSYLDSGLLDQARDLNFIEKSLFSGALPLDSFGSFWEAKSFLTQCVSLGQIDEKDENNSQRLFRKIRITFYESWILFELELEDVSRPPIRSLRRLVTNLDSRNDAIYKGYDEIVESRLHFEPRFRPSCSTIFQFQLGLVANDATLSVDFFQSGTLRELHHHEIERNFRYSQDYSKAA